MAARSITDEEIALMKGMLALGMKNKDIQFYFNRPDRSVNSGRISQVAKGTYMWVWQQLLKWDWRSPPG